MTVRQSLQRYAFGRISPSAFPSMTSPFCVGMGRPLTLSDQKTGLLLLRKPSSISFPQVGQIIGNLLTAKIKTPCLTKRQRRTPLRYHSSCRAETRPLHVRNGRTI